MDTTIETAIFAGFCFVGGLVFLHMVARQKKIYDDTLSACRRKHEWLKMLAAKDEARQAAHDQDAGDVIVVDEPVAEDGVPDTTDAAKVAEVAEPIEVGPPGAAGNNGRP